LIVITHTSGKIDITGHANYAPIGQDIVCSAVSALTQVFIASVDKLTTDNLKCDIKAGKAVILYKNLTKDAQLLLSSFLFGLKLIAEQYPNNVKLTDHRSQ
jgi:uncharacterized protein YsxB (DUF464 family)